MELIKEILTHPTLLLVGAVTVIEIVPIKINPWKTLFHWIYAWKGLTFER